MPKKCIRSGGGNLRGAGTGGILRGSIKRIETSATGVSTAS